MGSGNMNIVKNLVPVEKYNIKCPYTMNPEFIVVHNTANKASARNEIAYMISNNNETSFHYAIDDKEIVQGILETRNAWHASDGGKGEGNRKGIAIEICYSYCLKEVNGKWVEDEETWNAQYKNKFIAAEKLAARFIASKLKEKGWGIDKVKKHQDFGNHKYCPHRTLDMGWQRFLNMIQGYMNALSSTSPSITNNKVLYRIQIGAFGVKANAESYLKKVKAAGFDAFIVKVGKLYKIQVGAFGVKANADKYLAKVKAAGFSAFITTESGDNVTSSVISNEIKVGDKVKLKSSAYIYGTKTKFAPFVYNSTLYIRQINGDKVVISTQKTGAITGTVNKNDLTKI